MRFANYVVEADLRSRQPITHFKIHRHGSSVRHLIWWKLSMMYGPAGHGRGGSGVREGEGA